MSPHIISRETQNIPNFSIILPYILSALLSTTQVYTQINTNTDNTSQTSIVEEIDAVFGSDALKMRQVAMCESNMREYDPNSPDGLLHGVVNPDDIGIFQINLDQHKPELEATTTDIKTAHGNIMFAKYLFDKYGLAPWKPSQPCRRKIAYKLVGES